MLVVISIIGLLIAILLPVLGAARESARSIACSSNLRQVAIAATTLAADQQHFPGAQENITDERGWTVSWFGAHTLGPPEFDVDGGYLGGYWGDAEVSGCPSTTNDTREQYGPVDYAYNVIYLGARFEQAFDGLRVGVKPGSVRNPVETVMFMDSARFNGGTVQRVPWGYPPGGWPTGFGFNDERPTFHARHGGRGTEGVNSQSGNAAWADGHVTAERPVYYSTYNGGSAGIEIFEQNGLGDIDPNDDDIRDIDLWDLE
ncbi:MAG: DUF1559 domain-containing protein [Planctomycetota bacterium]